jgi:ribose/xylose/arabinose/galactoside ABC-type transport system permease subunit
MKVLGWSILPTIMVGLGIGIVVGGLTGLLSVSLNLHPLLVSLGTMTIYRGVSYMISKSRAYFDLPANFKYLGQGYVGKVPFSLFVVVIAFLIMDFILRKTYFGRYTYAVGGNPDAARLAGISIGRMKVILFSISGFFAGLSAVMMTARAGSANSAMGPGTEFDAITACVLGGVSFMGGEGNLSGVMVAAIILGILSNGMQLVGLGVYTQFVAKGIILIGALAYDDYQRRRTTTV